MSITILASAINFIGRKTVETWISESLSRDNRKWKRFFLVVYDFMFWSYIICHLGLFLYNTALVAMSINLVHKQAHKNPSLTYRASGGAHLKDWSSFLLVMTAALRGSFAQFFFAKFFQGCHIPKVSTFSGLMGIMSLILLWVVFGMPVAVDLQQFVGHLRNYRIWVVNFY